MIQQMIKKLLLIVCVFAMATEMQARRRKICRTCTTCPERVIEVVQPSTATESFVQMSGTPEEAIEPALEDARHALEAYKRSEIDYEGYPDDTHNIIKYFDYYRTAQPSWNFTVTPPTFTLSEAARNYVQQIQEIAGQYNLRTAGGILHEGEEQTNIHARRYYNKVLSMTKEELS